MLFQMPVQLSIPVRQTHPGGLRVTGINYIATAVVDTQTIEYRILSQQAQQPLKACTLLRRICHDQTPHGSGSIRHLLETFRNDQRKVTVLRLFCLERLSSGSNGLVAKQGPDKDNHQGTQNQHGDLNSAEGGGWLSAH